LIRHNQSDEPIRHTNQTQGDKPLTNQAQGDKSLKSFQASAGFFSRRTVFATYFAAYVSYAI